MRGGIGKWVGGVVTSAVFMLSGETEIRGEGVVAQWKRIAPLPDNIGVAGAFAGVSRGALIVAGGANFPGNMPGKKVWHDAIYVLEEAEATWKSGFQLPYPVAYGVSITLPQGVLCIGGSDADKHFANAFLMTWSGRQVVFKDMPPLPMPVANACGAAAGEWAYVAGGTEAPDSVRTLRRVYRLSLKRGKAWEEVPSWPGSARMLANAAGLGNSFIIAGGTDLKSGTSGSPERIYLQDAFAYSPGAGWKRLADMPYPVVAAANPAPVIANSQLFLVGGDDGSMVGLRPQSQHPGFPRKLLRYDAVFDEWTIAGETPAPRATLPSAPWRGLWVFPSGEVRPRVRSPEVWTLRLETGPR